MAPHRTGLVSRAARSIRRTLFKYNIPTGAAASFNDAGAAIEYLDTASYPIVIKADGLAAGKG